MGDLRSAIHRVATSAAGTYAAYVAHGLLHPTLLRANAGPAAQEPMPGDSLVREPHWATTFAIPIGAPREAVWPWIVQIGYGRAGWYTWYRYDNGGVPSAERVVAELQHLRVGDVIGDTVMERTLLEGVKERAERAYRNGGGHA
jgi:proline iminopeptidase